MKRGKDEEKTMGPMFPRLHVNDTEKGGPRAPPRNKMALYEQLSIPSQRFNGGVLPNSFPPSSSTPGTMNERGTNSPIQQSSPMHPTRKRDTHHSDFSNQRVHQEHRRQEDDDFRVPVFDQQSGTSQNRSVNVNHQNRENEGIAPFGAVFSGRLANVQNDRQSNRFQKENSSASNQSSRQNIKAPLKETNESSSFSHRNASNNSSRLQSNGNLRDYRLEADNTLWGDNVLNEASKVGFGNASVPVREVQQEAARSPDDPTNADAVSETSMVDSICGVDISPDDVVGIIGQKHFWKARRAIVNQQRVFGVQVFELHRLIKVQRLIAGSPHLLVDDNAYLAKPPKVSPIKKLPLEYVLKSTLNTPKHKTDIEKPNEDTEFSAENAVGKASPSSVQNDSQAPNCRPFPGNPLPPPEPSMGGSWNFNPPPGHQWLIPVMSPSEGLVYKPYPGPGFMNHPLYGGCGPPPGSMPMIGHNFPNCGVPPDHHYEGPTGVHPFTPPASHGYFPAYGMPPMVNPSVSSSRCEQTNPFNMHQQSSSNVPIEKKGAAVPNVVKFKASKDSEVQASTASSRSDRTRDRNALPLFPISPPAAAPASRAPAAAPVRFEPAEPARVIRVVPHNARSATASVARIFQSIQEERKQYDSG